MVPQRQTSPSPAPSGAVPCSAASGWSISPRQRCSSLPASKSVSSTSTSALQAALAAFPSLSPPDRLLSALPIARGKQPVSFPQVQGFILVEFCPSGLSPFSADSPPLMGAGGSAGEVLVFNQQGPTPEAGLILQTKTLQLCLRDSMNYPGFEMR